MTRYVHRFDEPVPEGARTVELKELLGGKGAGLRIMTSLGIPVPPGFTLTTEVCARFREQGGTYPEGLEDEVKAAVAAVEEGLGRKLGDPEQPLLLSVRSGARVSMPGMMDTILNLGLNDETVEGLARASGDRRFAWDAYRRFLQMYGDVVLGVEHDRFEDVLRDVKREQGDERASDASLSEAALEEVVRRHKKLVADTSKDPFPEDAWSQLWGAIGAVFESWDNPRAERYRKMEGIPGHWGTACNVQAMVFGNLGEDSGSGVAFTRNPSNGEPILYGEYLPNAQGEDVVAGIRTPLSLTAEAAPPGREDETLERKAPEVFKEVRDTCNRLERHFGDMQDVEFTVERGKVYLLQTRNGKRTAHASVRIAVDMVDEGIIDSDAALLGVNADNLEQLLHPRLPAPEALAERGVHALASGLPASPGAASGRIVFDADEAEAQKAKGRDVVLVRRETSPEDIHGMKAATGILTATGGMTSHAAVVARGLGKCCVAGASALQVDYNRRRVVVRSEESGTTVELGEEDDITLDGTHGKIYQGTLEVEAAAKLEQFDRLMGWADDRRRLRVRANADTVRGARSGRQLGAEGIGLCRTEHMFFTDERLSLIRCMALSETRKDREHWLGRLEPELESDFAEIFRAMRGCPVTVRLLDWPLHEFLPREEADFDALASMLQWTADDVRARSRALGEVNPMLGHRGVRVGLTYPEIYASQARAILSAAVTVAEEGAEIVPEIMIPVVAMASEVAAMRSAIDEEAQRVFERRGRTLEYNVGTMIELPRACLIAEALAEQADFFSFGTNDLTQTTYGISRDDAAHFLPAYLEDSRGLLAADPFARLDREGVGGLVRIGVERGRRGRSDLGLGLCGEHGGDPSSIAFCEEVGLEYVSCSPPRLPVARLAAAQARIRAERSD